jgi:hypothetical protein
MKFILILLLLNFEIVIFIFEIYFNFIIYYINNV